VSDIEYPNDLVELERSAWTAIQAGTLTVGQAHAVQAAITVFAAEQGLDRHKVEMGLKKAVRHNP
jgi:hypothetical protein